MKKINITLRWDISSHRKRQQLDKTKSQLNARIIEDDIFDEFKSLRDGLHLVPCPDHQETGSTTTFRESKLVKLSTGKPRGTIVDFTIHDCCCEKIEAAAIVKFKYSRLKRIL